MRDSQLQKLIAEAKMILSDISNLLNKKWIRRFWRIYSIFCEWWHADLKDKLKILVKVFLRPFGIKKQIVKTESYKFNEHISMWFAMLEYKLDRIQLIINKIQEKSTICGDSILAEYRYDSSELLSLPERTFFQFKKKWNKIHSSHIQNFVVSMQKDLVSVVLPVFNGEDYVADSINSVLAQDYDNFELIIIDDGSTDRTSKIVDDFSKTDSRIRAIHQENQKLPRTLSNGFKIARGEFCTWTSADNIMHPDFISQLVKELQNHPETAMVYANIRLIDRNGTPLRDFQWYPDPSKPENVLFPHNILNLNTVANNYIGAAFMYRAAVSHAIGDYSANRYGTEDYDYWMRVNECFELRHIDSDAPIYDYRIHPQSLTSHDKELKITENRYRLMLWDDFRRNYLLRPSLWKVDDSLGQSQWGEKLIEILKQTDQAIIQDPILWGKILKNPYYTSIELGMNFLDTLPSNDVCAPTCQVVISETATDTITDNPDTYISLSPVTERNFLPNYRGWYYFDDQKTMIDFLIIRAKSNALFEMETITEQSFTGTKKLTIVVPYLDNIENLIRVLRSLLVQTCDAATYEIAVPVTLESQHEIDRVLEELIQDGELRAFSVPLPFFNQCECINSVLWSTHSNYISMIDSQHICDISYVDNIIKIFDKFPRAAAVYSGLKDKDLSNKSNPIFQKIDKISAYQHTGCIAFRTSELRTVGGAFVPMEDSAAAADWERYSLVLLLQQKKEIIETNAVLFHQPGSINTKED